jgi:hypothetical protein
MKSRCFIFALENAISRQLAGQNFARTLRGHRRIVSRWWLMTRALIRGAIQRSAYPPRKAEVAAKAFDAGPRIE